MTFNVAHLRERINRDECSVPLCPDQTEILYVPGATPANPADEEGDGKWIGLCARHHALFCLMSESRHPAKSLQDEREA